MVKEKSKRKRGGGQCEKVMIQCLLVASPSFSVEKITRLGSILRFRSTVNKAAFDIRIGGLGLRRLDYRCFRSRRLRLGLCRGGDGTGSPIGVGDDIFLRFLRCCSRFFVVDVLRYDSALNWQAPCSRQKSRATTNRGVRSQHRQYYPKLRDVLLIGIKYR